MKNNKKGIAMLVVISLILMLLILGGGVLLISTGQFGTSYRQIRRARAYYAAEAVIQHALWGCRTGTPGYNLAIPPGGSITPPSITVNDPNYSHTVDITIYAEGEQGAPTGTHRIDLTIPAY